MPLETSPEQPVPVRVVAKSIADWVHRLGRVWVEGQVAQLTRRTGTTFLTLRDPVADVSLTVTCDRAVCDSAGVALTEGARVVIDAKPSFYLSRGTLSLQAFDIRPVGIGELLARLERLKVQLRTEGLFEASRKKPLPFLPRAVGLVTGRQGAAERDVVENARLRWPAVRFEVRQVAVQGGQAALQCADALRELDAHPEVDVIVLARGGGSVEDLLPFSDEGLCRAVAACQTPVVSAIGHEQDTPLLDFVADLRCSTPTDAGKRVVPDVGEETQRVGQLRDRGRRVLLTLLDRETSRCQSLASRPVLARPELMVAAAAEQLAELRRRAGRCASHQLVVAGQELQHARTQLLALSPQATLERGYAVARRPDRQLVRDPAEVASGEPLELLLARGVLPVRAV